MLNFSGQHFLLNTGVVFTSTDQEYEIYPPETESDVEYLITNIVS